MNRLKWLLPAFRQAQEKDMKEELDSLAAMAEPGELGNLTRAAEEARAVWSWMFLEQLYRDAQYALRTLRHNPGFTATAVLSLALGIGANTAIFSLIDAVMLRWLPVRDPRQLVELKLRSARAAAHPVDTLSYTIVNALASQKVIFSNVCGFSAATFDVGPTSSVNRVQGAWVTGEYYDTLGLNPAEGRLLGPADDRPGAPLVAVIGYGYWERQFAGSPDAVGQSMRVNGVPVTIVGVSPRGFTGANVGIVADVTVTVATVPQLAPAAAGLLGPGNFWLHVLARPSVPIQQAGARLDAAWPPMSDQVISTNWPAARRKEMAESTFDIAPGGAGYTYLRERFKKPLFVLMGVTGLVLLIACANVASLLLARATARQREISVRLAIGAGRGRIIRQLLTESTLLSLLGAALGVWLAWLTSSFLLRILSGGGSSPSIVFDLAPNWHILAFTTAVSIANGVLFGLIPAFQTTALGGAAMVKDGDRTTRSRSRLLSSLVSVQVALSLLLLVGAGLFLRTLTNILNVDPGFRREGILLVDLDGQREGYRDARLMAFYKDLLDRIQRLSGVASATISTHTPQSGATWSEAVVPKGQPLPEGDNAIFIAAGPNFFATMQTPLIAGREFDERDRGSARVAIINQKFAARFFPGQNPVGQYLTATVSKTPSDLQIIGVAHDTLNGNLRANPRPTVYVSYFQQESNVGTLEIRAAGGISQIASAVRKELQPSFPNTPVEVRPLTEQMERTLIQERLMASLAAGFGVLGLLLACVGLYGLLSYSMVRRTKEIGIRVALGAQPSGVVWMVARDALRLMGFGIALGLPVACALSRSVQSMLFGLIATDPVTIGTAVLLLGAAGLVAAYVPARRASRIDPMTALRHE